MNDFSEEGPHVTYEDGWCPSCAGTHLDAPEKVRVLRHRIDPNDDLAALPITLFVGANRYDTGDGVHRLHLWTADGRSFDVTWFEGVHIASETKA